MDGWKHLVDFMELSYRARDSVGPVSCMVLKCGGWRFERIDIINILRFKALRAKRVAL
jgi:hypothetical protein